VTKLHSFLMPRGMQELIFPTPYPTLRTREYLDPYVMTDLRFKSSTLP